MTAAARWCARVGLAAMGLLVAVVASAFAQGFYYKEIAQGRPHLRLQHRRGGRAVRENRRDGPRHHAGPGAGPNGETVVGDNERALQLFFFKHGISEAVPEPPPPLQRIEWRDGKTRITTDLAYLEISNRVQVRYTHELPDDTIAACPAPRRPGDSRGSFRIRRAKFKLEGWFWHPPDVAPAPGLCRAIRTRCSSTGRPVAPARNRRRASSKTPTSRGIRRGGASSASCSGSSRCRSAASR